MTQRVEKRHRLIVSNAINILLEINGLITENMRKGQSAELQFPRLMDRAFITHHEAGVVPVVDLLSRE